MFEMSKFVLFLIFAVSIVRCDFGRPDGIKLFVTYNDASGKMNCISNSANYFEEKQYIFVSYSTTHNTRSVTSERCYNKNNESRTFAKPTLELSYHLAPTLVSVDVDMGTIWTCQFLYSNRDRFSCHFPVYVRYRDAVKISINNNALNTDIPNYSVTDYDVESYYIYDDDELVYITCKLVSGFGMKFDVIGFNNESLIPLTDYTYDKEEIHLRAVLNKKYNLSHIDCIIKKKPYRDAIHRIFMKPKEDVFASSGDTGTHTDAPIYAEDDLIIRVNGLILAPISDGKSASYRTPSYSYEEGEIVNITCKKLTTSTEQLELSFGDKIKREAWKVMSTGPNVVTASINTSEINKNNELLVSCRILGNNDETVSLKKAPKNDVIIQGLLQRNIILAYNNSNGANVRIYEYKDNEVLNLTWMLDASSDDKIHRVHVLLTWKDKLLVNSEYLLSNSIKNITSQMIHLSPQDDGSIIQCIVIYSRKHAFQSWIVLRRELYVGEENITGNNELQLNSKILVPVSSVACIVIVLAVLSIIYICYRKCKRSPEEKDESNEVNDLTQISTQFPESWDEYANTMLNGTQTSSSYVDLKCLYDKPIPKKDRQLKDQVVVRENSLYESLEQSSRT